ncbi:hypothetical protein K9L27_02995 [Candidatus Gracilibacteria bacterium]|nr:hypothetical protein [Candidatus Gracilibacteria bacterium]
MSIKKELPEHLQQEQSMVRFIVEQVRMKMKGGETRDNLSHLDELIKNVISETQQLVLGAIKPCYAEKELRFEDGKVAGLVRDEVVKQELVAYLEEEIESIDVLFQKQGNDFDEQSKQFEQKITDKEDYFYTMRQSHGEISDMPVDELVHYYEEFVQVKNEYEIMLKNIESAFLETDLKSGEHRLKDVYGDGIFFQETSGMTFNINNGITLMGELLQQADRGIRNESLQKIINQQQELKKKKNRLENKVLKKIQELHIRVERLWSSDTLKMLENTIEPIKNVA